MKTSDENTTETIMTQTTLKWTRFDTGCYRTTDGRWEVRSMAYHSEGLSSEKSWILFDRSDEDDGYCNHFATKRDACEGAAELSAAGNLTAKKGEAMRAEAST